MSRFSVIILMIFFLSNPSIAQEISDEDIKTTSFTLKIEGIKKVEGEMRIAVFNSKEAYTKEAIYAIVMPVESESCVWKVEDLPYGEYAIAVYHDRNENGKLDTNFIGIPKELYGFSNNARGKFGPAKWKNAKFMVEESLLEQTIRIK